MPLKTVSETLGSHGSSLTYQAKDGRSHAVRPLTLKSMSRFEKWLESRAFASIISQREILGNDLQQAIAGVASDVAKGKYAFGGQDCEDALKTLPGMACLVSIMLDVDEIRGMHLLRTEADSLAPIVSQVMKESMPDLEGNVKQVEEAT